MRVGNFSYLSEMVGKGDNKQLSKVIKYDNNNNIVKVDHDK